MDLRHLRYFTAVAEELSFSRAAKQLHIAEPPLSRQIRQLEEELDVQLFLRDRRRVQLTPAGSILFKEAQSLLTQATHLLERMSLCRRGEVGMVRVGVATGLGEALRPVLAEHARRFPAVEVSCCGIFSGLQVDAIKQHKVDVGFLRSQTEPAGLISEPVFTERLVVLLSRKHPLAKRRKLKVTDLAAERLLLPDTKIAAGLHDRILELYRKAGITPKTSVATAPFDEAQILAVSLSKGICIAVESVLAYPGRGKSVVTIPLDDQEAGIAVRMAWRRDEKSVAVLAFLDTARGIFKQPHS